MAPRRKSFALFILLTIAFISIYRIGVEFNENSKRLRVGYKKPTYLKQPWYLFKHRCWHKFCTGNSSYSIKNVSWNMVIMVKSSANSFIRRDVLRRSWASLFYVEGGNVSVVFVVGKSIARKTERRLVEEQAKYGDILQFNGPDDYRNIALKTLAGMEWASVYLPEKFLYSSMDDDFMVDMLKFSKAIRTGFDNMTKNNWFEYPLICMFRMGVDEKPVREKGGLYQKWYIDESLFKWPVFPRYCHGGMYSTSMRIVQQLLEASYTVEPLYLDDVWITGILRQKIGMPDPMVLVPDSTVAVHYSGYTQSPTHNINAFVEAWQDSIDSMENANVCQCLR